MPATPAKRVTGCFVASTLYAGSLTALLLACLAVVDLGGFCATGGPLAAGRACGAEVVAVPPLAVLAGLVATGFALGWARGTGRPWWRWPRRCYSRRSAWSS